MSSTNYYPDVQRISGFKKFSILVTGASMLASLIILIGLAFNFYPFKGLIVGMDATKPLGAPLGAVGFLSASTALLLLQPVNGKEKSWRRVFGLICAGLTFLIGGTVLLEYMLGADFGIDRLLLRDVVLSNPGIFPGRPIFLVSVCQTILGLALLAIYSKVRGLDLFVFGTLFVGLIAMIEYIYGSAHLASVGSSRPFPLPSALLLIFVSMGYLTARPESHFMAPISSPLAGGLFARRFFPAAILLPLLLGWLEIIGQRAGLYSIEFGRVLFSASNILIFIGLVYWNVRQLNEVDIQRGATNVALRQSEERFRTLFNVTPAGKLMVEPGGKITLANATAENIFGYKPGQLTGKQVEILLPKQFRAQHPMFRHFFETGEHPHMSVTGRNLLGLRQDGSEFPVEISIIPIETSEGRFTLASVSDITERKRIEDEIRSLNATLEQRVLERTQQLEYERARWQGIVEGMAEEVWSCDTEGKMSLLNLGSTTMMGLEPFTDKSVEEVYQEVEILYPDGRLRPPDQAPLLLSLRGEIVRGEEIMRHRQTDIKRYRQYSSAPIHDETGTITGAVAIVRDITEQKQAKEVLSRYDLLSANSKDIVLFIHRENHSILEANAAAIRAYGYSRDELMGLNLLDLRAPETRSLAKEQIEQADSIGLLFETIHIRKDGSTFPVEVSSQGATINGVRTLISIVRDVTERKQAEQALHQSEERFAFAFRASPVGINIFRFSDGRSVDANDAFLSLTGYSRDELLGHTDAELNLVVDPEQRAEWMREVNEHGSVRSLDFTLRKKSGEIANVLFSLVKIDFGGESMGLTMAIDITKRKLAEAQLAYQAKLLSQVSDAVIGADENLRITYWNASAERLFGWTADETLGKETRDFFNTLVPSASHEEAILKFMETDQFDGEVRYARKNGEHFIAHVLSVVMRGPEGDFTGLVTTIRDITERKRMENALRASEERYRAIIENAKDAILVTDPSGGGKVLSVNAAACHMFGYTKKEFLKLDREAIVDLEDPNLATMMEQREKHGQATTELTYKRKNGERFSGELSSVFYRDKNRHLRSIAIIRDVTERKQAEDALRESENQFRTLIESAPIAISLGRGGNLIYANPGYVKIHGFDSADEIVGRPVLERVAPQSREKALEHSRKRTQELSTEGQYELIGLRKDGTEFPMLASMARLRLSDGPVNIGFFQDITESKQLEDALRESEQKYTLLFEKSAVPTALLKLPEVIIMDANEACEKLTGYTRQEMLGKTEVELGLLGSREWAEVISEFERQGEFAGNESRIFTKNGEVRIAIFSISPIKIHGQMYAISAMLDVTERKKTEEQLAKLTNRLSLSTYAAHMGIWDWDIQTNKSEWNEQMYMLYGLKPGELEGGYESWLNGIHPEDQVFSQEAVQQALRGGREYNTEYRVLWPDGSVHWLKAHGQVFREENGTPVRMLGVNYEITELKQAEMTILESEERFSTAFHSSPVPQAIATQGTGKILVVNDAFCRLFEYSREELVGDTTTKLRLWENEADRESALEELRTTGHMLPRETAVRTRSGKILVLIGSIEPISWKGIPSAISSVIDITARKQAEEQITAALQEKEVLLKEVHHRVKNNLQVISSLLRLQSTGLSDPHVRELFAESQRRVRAMALIHEQLYQSANLAQINLKDYITSLVNYLRHSYAQTISKVETQINVEDSIIEMDRAMPIGLLVSELVSNSLKYAFLPSAEQQNGKIWVEAKQEKDGLILAIGDNGAGLPEGLDIKHTTSMGLQLVDSFVTQLQGQLTVQRKPGTVFTIYIPNKG